MKYVFINDLNYLIKYKYKIILGYLFALLIYYISTKDIGLNMYFIDIIFATTINFKENIFDIYYMVFTILNYSFVIYLSLEILKKDLDSYDNLYLRISLTKWITTKVIVLLLIFFVINSIMFLIVYSFKSVELIYYIVILKKIIFSILIAINIYILLLLYNKTKILFVIFLIPLIILCFSKIFISEINFLTLFICLFAIYLCLFTISKFIKFSDLKE